MKNAEDATQHILEKEVESILRKSHAEHFSIMENKFSIKLRTGLDIWPVYIELTERRNLFVHCDGVVSKQYLKVCKEHNVDIKDIKLADRLTADRKYLKQSFEVLYEISTKLVHVLWRKLFANERKYADSALNEIAYNLIVEKRFNLAISVLDFGLNVIKKHDNETTKRMMIINLALALKKNNEAKKGQNILKQYDWTAIGYEFKLAHSVLSEDYQEAAVLLNKVVSIGDLSEAEIIDWPVFEEFRETKDFRVEYQKLFGKEYEEKSIEDKIDKEEISNQVAKKVESEEIS